MASNTKYRQDVTCTFIPRTWSPVWLEQGEQWSKGGLGGGQVRGPGGRGEVLRRAWQVAGSTLALTLREEALEVE